MTKNINNWTALDSAVVDQLGFGSPIVDCKRVTLEEDAAGELESVGRCSCGAAGGFGGFIYYHDTWEFFRANRDAIRAALQGFAEEIGEGCAVDLVLGFNCYRDENEVSADDIGRILFGELPDKWEEHRNAAGEWVSGAAVDPFCVANACVFFALEETANKWNESELFNG